MKAENRVAWAECLRWLVILACYITLLMTLQGCVPMIAGYLIAKEMDKPAAPYQPPPGYTLVPNAPPSVTVIHEGF